MSTQWLQTAQQWAIETALPFWGSTGVDEISCGFHERFTLQGEPIDAIPRRLMVQARQTYVFAHAYQLGWFPQGKAIAARGATHMIAHYYKADGLPGWVHSIDSAGKVTNPARDSYAHAFALYALSWAYSVTHDPQILIIVDETLEFLQRTLAHKTYGGYQNIAGEKGAMRLQNPHMHMFEAFLSLYEATQHDKYLALANEMYDLFTTRFFNHGAKILPEYFDEKWVPIFGDKGKIFEPGHHFEWASLMRKYQNLSGRDVSPYATALYETAYRLGFDSATGLIYDEVLENGCILTPSHRFWPLTEAIKANAIEHEFGRDGCLERVESLFKSLFSHYIGKSFAAGWVDHIKPNGELKTDFVPTSTLYHAFLSIAEANRVLGR